MNSHHVRWLGEWFSRLNTSRLSLKVKAMVDEWLPAKGLCYPEVFKIWGNMAGDEGLVFYLLNSSALPAGVEQSWHIGSPQCRDWRRTRGGTGALQV